MKTLKELGVIHENVCDVSDNDFIYKREELIQEVINWIKYWMNRKDEYAKIHAQSICQEFCRFFNITEGEINGE